MARPPLPWLIVAAALALGATSASGAGADELVMVETEGCPWCAKWHREVGPLYAKTEEGRRLPLRRARLQSLPADLRHLADLRHAPTFVVLHCGAEAGRITGYGGDELFWGQLDAILARLPAAC